MDVALEIIDNFHKLFLVDAQVIEHTNSLAPVLLYIAENGLGKVFYHIFGLSLLLFDVRLDLLYWTIRTLNERTAIWVLHELEIFLKVRSEFWDTWGHFHSISGTLGLAFRRGTGTVDLLIIELPITRYFEGLARLICTFWTWIRTEKAFVEFLTQHGLPLKQFCYQSILSIDDLHHLSGKTNMTQIRAGSVRILSLQFFESWITMHLLVVIIEHFLVLF